MGQKRHAAGSSKGGRYAPDTSGKDKVPTASHGSRVGLGSCRKCGGSTRSSSGLAAVCSTCRTTPPTTNGGSQVSESNPVGLYEAWKNRGMK